MKISVNNLYSDNSCANQTMPHPKTSEKYKFINTADIIRKFAAYGWEPATYNEARSKKYPGFQTHTVSLFCNDEKVNTTVGDSRLRILIVNNHVASKSCQIKLGLFRLVCSNGMVVQDADLGNIAIRHIGLDVDTQIAEFIEKIAVAAEKLREKISSLQGKTMTTEEKMAFARSALTTRFKPELITPELVSAVLHVNRFDDQGDDAWRVFNTVQENLTRGFESADRDRRVRRITSVAKDLKINEDLWAMLPKAA